MNINKMKPGEVFVFVADVVYSTSGKVRTQTSISKYRFLYLSQRLLAEAFSSDKVKRIRTK